ncbi:hypothetical protein AX15_001767 [Amanita polypyramis BW_CC]|nr:hypothetical protein AX15_001767 [Amanita polypyramis BW_CC]
MADQASGAGSSLDGRQTSLTSTQTGATQESAPPTSPSTPRSATDPPTFVTSPANAPATPTIAPTQSNNGSAVHVAQNVTVVTLASTSTSTEFPVSTTPIAVTTVHDGTTSVGTPAFVTMLSTSTNSDDSAITWTHVYANPTGMTVTRPTSRFLQDTGAVAGVFAVVGVIAACLLLCTLYFIRRFRRTRRQCRWLQTLQSHHNDRDRDAKVPFGDHDSGPIVHSASLESISVVDNRMVHPAYDVAPTRVLKEPLGIRAGQKSQPWPTGREGLFNDMHTYKQSTTIDHLKPWSQATAHDIENTEITPGSTPSIYPASLPPVTQDGDENIIEPPAERNGVRDHVTVRERPRTAEAPPRPPRSALRNLSRPSTAPSSPDQAAQKDIYAILQRQTLLDVRPRSSQPSSEKASPS